MRVAVLSLTRDRLPYTRHCFQSLRERSGWPYDHFVLDQGSQDGTVRFLAEQLAAGELEGVIFSPENIGCCAGWNSLLEIAEPSDYDVIVTFDNDCEVLSENTLNVVASLAAEHDMILAPRVEGLMYPPPAISHMELSGYAVEETTILGNIFMAIPSSLLEDFRWDERYPVWDGGESITQWYRAHGGRCGYVSQFKVNHYLTTLGQLEDMPWYAERRVAEGGRSM